MNAIAGPGLGSDGTTDQARRVTEDEPAAEPRRSAAAPSTPTSPYAQNDAFDERREVEGPELATVLTQAAADLARPSLRALVVGELQAWSGSIATLPEIIAQLLRRRDASTAALEGLALVLRETLPWERDAVWSASDSDTDTDTDTESNESNSSVGNDSDDGSGCVGSNNEAAHGSDDRAANGFRDLAHLAWRENFGKRQQLEVQRRDQEEAAQWFLQQLVHAVAEKTARVSPQDLQTIATACLKLHSSEAIFMALEEIAPEQRAAALRALLCATDPTADNYPQTFETFCQLLEKWARGDHAGALQLRRALRDHDGRAEGSCAARLISPFVGRDSNCPQVQGAAALALRVCLQRGTGAPAVHRLLVRAGGVAQAKRGLRTNHPVTVKRVARLISLLADGDRNTSKARRKLWRAVLPELLQAAADAKRLQTHPDMGDEQQAAWRSARGSIIGALKALLRQQEVHPVIGYAATCMHSRTNLFSAEAPTCALVPAGVRVGLGERLAKRFHLGRVLEALARDDGQSELFRLLDQAYGHELEALPAEGETLPAEGETSLAEGVPASAPAHSYLIPILNHALPNLAQALGTPEVLQQPRVQAHTEHVFAAQLAVGAALQRLEQHALRHKAQSERAPHQPLPPGRMVPSLKTLAARAVARVVDGLPEASQRDIRQAQQHLRRQRSCPPPLAVPPPPAQA